MYSMRDVCYAGMVRYAGMVCYAGICVCYMMRYGYVLCGTGRRDGVRVHGMRYAIMSERASMRYAAGEDCKMVEIALKRAENRGM